MKLRTLMASVFENKWKEFLSEAYRVAYHDEQAIFRFYSKKTSRYLEIIMHQYQYGYVGCIVQDVTHNRIYEDALNKVMLSFREVYFLHLQENYCRLLYPDDNHILERGNYEEVINRHFSTGKILKYDETRIRKFLSLKNLKKALEKQDTVDYKYKRHISPSGEEWCQTEVMVLERKEDGIPKTAIITIRSIEALMREREDIRHRDMAKLLTTMSEGFFIYQATDDENLVYVNPKVMDIFGCDKKEEFYQLVNNTFGGLVHPEDLKRVQWEIHEQVKRSDTNTDFICYRIIRKDGTVRWIDDCGYLEDSRMEDEKKLFYVFISDITDTISDKEKNKLINKSKRFNLDA